MITGAHVVLFSRDAEADRAFFRDVLGLGFVDAGDGWLIFALPPAEVAVHPDADGGRNELYLTTGDVDFGPRVVLHDVELQRHPDGPPDTENGGGDATVVEEGCLCSGSGLGELLGGQSSQ